jgi:hypothetical protein
LPERVFLYSNERRAPVKLVRVIAFAMFFVAAPVASSAQSPDLSLSPPLCSDDYYDDTAGQCGAVSTGEILTIEAILAKYGVIVVDGDVIALYFDDLDDMPVGSIQPRNEDAVPTDDEPAIGQVDTMASRIIIADPSSETGGEAADEITTTGPSAQSIPMPQSLSTTTERSNEGVARAFASHTRHHTRSGGRCGRSTRSAQSAASEHESGVALECDGAPDRRPILK